MFIAAAIDLKTPSASSPSSFRQTVKITPRENQLRINKTLLLSIRKGNPDKVIRSNNSHSSRYPLERSVEVSQELAESRVLPVRLDHLPALSKSKLFSTREGALQDMTRRSGGKSSQMLVKDVISRYQRYYKPKNCSLSPNQYDSSPINNSQQREQLKRHNTSLHIPAELQYECNNIRSTISHLRKMQAVENTPYQQAIQRRKRQQSQSRDRVIQQIAIENSKRLRRVIACKQKLRLFRRWEIEQNDQAPPPTN